MISYVFGALALIFWIFGAVIFIAAHEIRKTEAGFLVWPIGTLFQGAALLLFLLSIGAI